MLEPNLYFKDNLWFTKGELGEVVADTPEESYKKYTELPKLTASIDKPTHKSDDTVTTFSTDSSSSYDVATQTAILATCFMM